MLLVKTSKRKTKLMKIKMSFLNGRQKNMYNSKKVKKSENGKMAVVTLSLKVVITAAVVNAVPMVEAVALCAVTQPVMPYCAFFVVHA